MTLNLNGLIPATVLPMHADGSIDEAGLRSYIGWIAGQGPVALAINVDTGEGPHLTHHAEPRRSSLARVPAASLDLARHRRPLTRRSRDGPEVRSTS